MPGPWTIAGLFLAYLVGAFPSGVLSARVRRDLDPRRHGSGSTGATNVARLLGWRVALLVVGLDILKGWVAARYVSQLPLLDGVDTQTAALLTGFAAIVGHVWPVFTRFHGGKGVATTGGVLLAVNPIAFAILLAAYLVVARTTRIGSAASLTAIALTAPVVHLVARWQEGPGPAARSQTIFALAAAALVALTHRRNIRDLLKGREHRF